MTDQRTTNQKTGSYTPSAEEPSSWAIGGILFAAVAMMMVGIFQVIAGVAALFENEFYVTTPNYVFEFDVTTWGWIHLVAGIVVGLAGLGVLRGNLAARMLGITIAALSAVVSFAFIPYQPLWSIAIIALDVFIIWALSAHGRDAARL
jgi:hypothetical protein